MEFHRLSNFRLWGAILLSLMILLSIGCGRKTDPKPTLPHKTKAVSEPGASDQLLLLEGDTVWLATKTAAGGKWVKQEVKGLEPPAEDAELSVPVIALSNDALICEIEPIDTDKEPQTINYKLYSFDVRNDQLKKQGVFQERLSEDLYYLVSSSWTLISWLPAERKMLFAFHIGEGFAGCGMTRLLDPQRAKTTYYGEDDEKKLLEKALGGEYDALNYSPDGKFLVMGRYKQLGVLNRETKQINTLPAPVTFFWAICMAADDATVAWVGETQPRPQESPEEEQVIDYFPVVDHFGLIDLASGTSKTWAMDEIKGIDFAGMQEPNQMFARVAYSPKSKNYYFSWGGSGSVLVGFDTSRETASIIDGDGGRFTLISDAVDDRKATAKSK
jgi:hypothetical protein